jgi:hypothetical protein
MATSLLIISTPAGRRCDAADCGPGCGQYAGVVTAREPESQHVFVLPSPPDRLVKYSLNVKSVPRNGRTVHGARDVQYWRLLGTYCATL